MTVRLIKCRKRGENARFYIHCLRKCSRRFNHQGKIDRFICEIFGNFFFPLYIPETLDRLDIMREIETLYKLFDKLFA